jgi:hypothetical protein
MPLFPAGVSTTRTVSTDGAAGRVGAVARPLNDAQHSLSGLDAIVGTASAPDRARIVPTMASRPSAAGLLRAPGWWSLELPNTASFYVREPWQDLRICRTTR